MCKVPFEKKLEIRGLKAIYISFQRFFSVVLGYFFLNSAHLIGLILSKSFGFLASKLKLSRRTDFEKTDKIICNFSKDSILCHDVNSIHPFISTFKA